LFGASSWVGNPPTWQNIRLFRGFRRAKAAEKDVPGTVRKMDRVRHLFSDV
jgi:hypothetical protein